MVEQVRVREGVDKDDMCMHHAKKLRPGKTMGTTEANDTLKEEAEFRIQVRMLSRLRERPTAVSIVNAPGSTRCIEIDRWVERSRV